jgi:hypothetical protein
MPTLKATNNAYLEVTIAFREKLDEGFIVLGERLRKIRNERMYADEYDSFPDFLRELRLSESTASKLIAVYEKFVVLGGIPIEELGRQAWTNRAIFLPVISTKKDAVAIYNQVAPLDRTDAMRVYEEMKRGVDMGTCPHAETRTLIVCCTCGIKLEQPK